jgi:hypothetical protein
MFQTRTFTLLAVLAAFVSVPAHATLSVLSSPKDTTPPAAAGAPAQGGAPTQAAAPSAGQLAGSPENAQDIQKEIEQGNQQFKDTYNALNKMNPMAVHPPGGTPADPSADPSGANGLVPSAISPELQVQIQRVQALLSNPSVQKYLKVFTNPEVQNQFEALVNSPEKMTFVYFEIGWIVLILLLKIRLTMQSKNFLLIVFTQLWTSALFIVGSSYLVPRVVFGSLYLNFFNTVVAVLKS